MGEILTAVNLVILILLGINVAACQLAPSTPTLPPSHQGSGHLAYIGRDGNVYVTTVNHAMRQLTNDATASSETEGYSYHRLAWSPDGSLAFAGIRRAKNTFKSKLYIAAIAQNNATQLVGQSDESFVIYMHWSPVPCPNRPTCHRLAYLIEEADSISLRLVEIDENTIKNERIGLGRPFYFSWSPDGQEMLWHTGGAHRYNPAAQLIRYDLETGRITSTAKPTGLFLAPAWSPQGDRWLSTTAAAEINQLQLSRADSIETLSTATNRHIAFAWSPNGEQIAYALQENSDVPIYGPIHIFDTKTGQTHRLTEPRFRITGFFWSPDGQRLAYLVKLLPDAGRLQWRMYNLITAKDRGFTTFLPAFQMGFIIGSFNQYVQSHRLWSPDSRYLVYVDRDYWLVERVWLVDTWAGADTSPIFVAEGSLGIWSWQ